MRFSLSSSALSSRLLSLSRVINNKNSLPILSCFLFQVKDNVLTIIASDSENVMKKTIELTDPQACSFSSPESKSSIE